MNAQLRTKSNIYAVASLLIREAERLHILSDGCGLTLLSQLGHDSPFIACPCHCRFNDLKVPHNRWANQCYLQNHKGYR